jgi:hypothetical protein
MNFAVSATTVSPNLRRTMVAGVITVALLAGCSSSQDTAPTTLAVASATSVPAAAADLSAVVTFGELSRNHVNTSVQYPQNPPVGGDHSPAWANCGVYREVVPNELAVHSLEHGAVWIAYDPTISEADRDLVEALAEGQSHVLVSPVEGLSPQVVATAWSTQLPLEGATDPRLPLFIKEYQQGPQTPEPGAVCSGAIGTPR